MAERRMFARSIIESDAFLDFPMSARLLYFDLGMRGDDDGFVDSPRRIMRITGASDDDLKVLVAKQFIIPFESGVVVVRHWNIHNYIRSDRYKPTQYQSEKALLSEGINGVYCERLTLGIPTDYQLTTKCLPSGSIGEDRVIEGNRGKGILPGAEAAPDHQEPPIIEIVLNDGSFHPVYSADIKRWEELYPAVDVIAQLRKMAGWCDSNPKKRKTRNGVARFINTWLSNTQRTKSAAQCRGVSSCGSITTTGTTACGIFAGLTHRSRSDTCYGLKKSHRGTTMTERKIEAALVRAVKAAGGLALKLTSPGTAGVPDRLVLLSGGRAVFVELKRPGAKPRPLQLKRHGQIAALGFRVLTIDSTDALQEVLGK